MALSNLPTPASLTTVPRVHCKDLATQPPLLRVSLPADCHKIVLQLEEKQIPYVIEKM